MTIEESIFDNWTFDKISPCRGKFFLKISKMKDIAFLHRVMSSVLVFRCEMNFHRDAFEYHAISPLFDPIDIYGTHREDLPEYKVAIDEQGNLKMVRFVAATFVDRR